MISHCVLRFRISKNSSESGKCPTGPGDISSNDSVRPLQIKSSLIDDCNAENIIRFQLLYSFIFSPIELLFDL